MTKTTHFWLTLMAFLSLSGLIAPAAANADPAHTFSIGTNSFLLDGQPFQIRCGELHAARIPREYWRNRLKMAKAMGLNTVCAYLFWNQVEQTPGKFDWTGRADAAEFCRIAQEEGLWVILRPGPYSCAEWEEGGLPWWLLKDPDIHLRSLDPNFMDPAKKYLQQVGKELGPLQITRGGPILMVQVENEYGSYGQDTNYMGAMRDALRDAGFDVPLFECNPVYDLKHGFRPDIFPVVNFGKDPAKGFAALRQILPQGPLMCGEFYPGWFDTWGQPHHLGNTPQYLADLQYMLSHGESFSIYMVHGGTTFGLWSGADRPYKPDTSSYDYDAPISEAGWPTEKFYKTRELFSHYLMPGETLSDVPLTNAVITFAPVQADQCAPIFANLPDAIDDLSPRTMEEYNQALGCIDYRAIVPAGPPAPLTVGSIHDFGFIFLNGRRIDVMDRRATNFMVQLPERTAASTLDILVDCMGRINFGPQNVDRKGIHGPVQLNGTDLKDWNVFNLPLDHKMLAHLKFRKSSGTPASEGPAFWRATVKIKKPGDTFLDMRSWGKGVVWVNGHCLGRYWDIGPTQTMYLPGPWLKHGKNEIIILDLTGPENPVIAGVNTPILNELHPEKDFTADSKMGSAKGSY
jgi:beta-galactosidase